MALYLRAALLEPEGAKSAVQSEKDVIAAFRFSNCSGKKLAIKNSGHDYLTRSTNARGSMGLLLSRRH
jgi:hypothetical protein